MYLIGSNRKKKAVHVSAKLLRTPFRDMDRILKKNRVNAHDKFFLIQDIVACSWESFQGQVCLFVCLTGQASTLTRKFPIAWESSPVYDKVSCAHKKVLRLLRKFSVGIRRLTWKLPLMARKFPMCIEKFLSCLESPHEKANKTWMKLFIPVRKCLPESSLEHVYCAQEKVL